MDTLGFGQYPHHYTPQSVTPPRTFERNSVTTLIVEPDLRIHHPALGILLSLIALSVVFGNTLVMVAIRRERYLHTVTNYFIASLAAADCLVGAIVMPFSVVHEIMNHWWVFGSEWCDWWHGFDVLASTASILNLCVISLDRYWAITNPITYPSRMTPTRAGWLIVAVWTCSSLISFPAILWWRHVAPGPPPPYQCLFTDDIPYLVFSSIVSFYGPLIVMIFVYWRIYKAAVAQTKSLKLGTKQIGQVGPDGEGLTLRIHRGKYIANQSDFQKRDNSTLSVKRPVPEELSAEMSTLGDDGENGSGAEKARGMKVMTTTGRKAAKLAKERKAAKTLAIVMGVFILCWLPFFVTNVLMGVCESCILKPELVFSIVTWLGWTNSALNPAIYACWSRDFRRAFRKILCGCCDRRARRNLGNQRFSQYAARGSARLPMTHGHTYKATVSATSSSNFSPHCRLHGSSGENESSADPAATNLQLTSMRPLPNTPPIEGTRETALPI